VISVASVPGPDSFERTVVGFASALRAAGLVVPVDSTATFAAALGVLGPVGWSSLYWAGRTTLVTRPEDVTTFDRVFVAWWGRNAPAEQDQPLEVPSTLLLDDLDADPPAPGPETDADDDEPIVVRYSASEVLRHKDMATCTPDELSELARLMAVVRLGAGARPSRRHRPTSRRRGRIDLRHTVARALRTDGEILDRRHSAPGTTPRRIVLLCDVSGSMDAYARALLRFAHASVAGRARVEAFTFGTRLTRLTRQLATHDPDVALERASETITDWAGGTRLGASLRCFNDEWGIRGMARGAVVVILSDGWDRGAPDELAEQMARLSRVAHRIVWVNPLKASPGYAPLAQGMAAALPFVDDFLEGHSLASFEDLARRITA